MAASPQGGTMSDFQSAVEYYLEKARSAADRGSEGELEEQLSHMQSLLEHYCEKSSPNNISETPIETSLTGEFTNFYRTLYHSCATSPNPDCVVLTHRYTWRGIFTARREGQGKVFSALLSVAFDQYLDQKESAPTNETVCEHTISNTRNIFQSIIGALEDAQYFVEIQDIKFQFDEFYSVTRRVVRELPKSGTVDGVEGIFNLLSNLLLNPERLEADLIEYGFEIRSETSQDSSDETSAGELRDEMSLAARQHRTALWILEKIENLQFVGSAWITHLHLEGIVSNEQYLNYSSNVIHDKYSNTQRIAKAFLQLTNRDGYWEMWDLHRRMDASPNQMVSSGSATWGWVLEFYLLQMTRVILENENLEDSLIDENPIPMEDILRVRTSRILDVIGQLQEHDTFHELLSPPFSDDEIASAVQQLHEAHEQRRADAEASWETTIRNTEIPESRKIDFRENLSSDILSNFPLHEVFESLEWTNTQDEAPDRVEINSHVLGRLSFQKRTFIDDPYVSQHLNTSQISSQLAAKATETWLEAFGSTELSISEHTDVAESLIEHASSTSVVCFIVDIGDERRTVINSEDFSHHLDGGEELLSNVAIAGYLAEVPVITTPLRDAKAIIINDGPKTVYEQVGSNPFSINIIPGDEWQQRHPNSNTENSDPELSLIVEVEYSFGVQGDGVFVVR